MAIPPLYIVVGLCSKESGYDKELLANKNWASQVYTRV